MSKVADVRRRTAEKLAQPAGLPKRNPPPDHIRSRLDAIRQQCELRAAERKALEAEPANRQETEP
jgi:hypothetical protein